jgi:hypothetical protein
MTPEKGDCLRCGAKNVDIVTSVCWPGGQTSYLQVKGTQPRKGWCRECARRLREQKRSEVSQHRLPPGAVVERLEVPTLGDDMNWFDMDETRIPDLFEQKGAPLSQPDGFGETEWVRCTTRCLTDAKLCKHLLYGGETYAMCNRDKTLFSNSEQITGLGPHTRFALRRAYRRIGITVSDGIVWPRDITKQEEDASS